MIGTRTARTVVFGLLGIMAGLVLPTAGSARPLAVTSTPVMRGAGSDLRVDDLSRAEPASRAGEADGRTAQLPTVAYLPKLGTEFPVFIVLVSLLAMGTAMAMAARATGARAPPRRVL